MAISDKTRKILWGKSGNRCAMCKEELVSEPSKEDKAVIGEECHIKSGKANGPRFDPELSQDKVDNFENLILLCCNHHTEIDDLPKIHTTSVLLEIKNNHMKWISEKLNNETSETKIARKIPDLLPKITNGKELLCVLRNACEIAQEYDELESEDEVETIGYFVQSMKDYMDIIPDLEPLDLVKIEYELTKYLNKLAEQGFWVFAQSTNGILSGGSKNPENWKIANIKIVKNNNPEILKVDLSLVETKALI